MKIVADPNIPFVREAFAALGDVSLVPGRQINAAAVRDAEVLLVRSVTRVNAALLDGSRVKFVATATIGTDHIDLPYLASRGIGFAYAPGSNANSVAEYVVAAMLEIAHREKFRLRDKTLGVVGVGNVGSRVFRYAEALGMRVLQNDPPRERAEVGTDRRAVHTGGAPGGRALPFVSLECVLAEADIITLHVPLTNVGQTSRLPEPNDEQTGRLLHFLESDATYQLFGAATLGALKRQPLLINTARGAVVDNAALLAAIANAQIGPAVLDVWENEPNISTDLLNIVDLGTPHIAGYSFDGKVNGTRMIYEAVCRHFALKPACDFAEWMPAPGLRVIDVTADHDVDDEEVLHRVIKRLYDITADDTALRKNPQAFDKLRAEYPNRREFHNTELKLHGEKDSLRQKFTALGFCL